MSKLDANQLCAELCMITDFKKSTLVQHVPECPKYSAARPESLNDPSLLGRLFATEAVDQTTASDFSLTKDALDDIRLLIADSIYADDRQSSAQVYEAIKALNFLVTNYQELQNKLKSPIVVSSIETNRISDGYHTFGELYEHRIRLWITVCSLVAGSQLYHGDDKDLVWMSAKHSDDSVIDGWFVLGIGVEAGRQITYHLPNSYWDECAEFAVIKQAAPEFDGHTSSDVLKRMKRT